MNKLIKKSEQSDKKSSTSTITSQKYINFFMPCITAVVDKFLRILSYRPCTGTYYFHPFISHKFENVYFIPTNLSYMANLFISDKFLLASKYFND